MLKLEQLRTFLKYAKTLACKKIDAYWIVVILVVLLCSGVANGIQQFQVRRLGRAVSAQAKENVRLNEQFESSLRQRFELEQRLESVTNELEAVSDRLSLVESERQSVTSRLQEIAAIDDAIRRIVAKGRDEDSDAH